MNKERKSEDNDVVVVEGNTSLELLQPPRVRWRANRTHLNTANPKEGIVHPQLAQPPAS
jgi:hypothetical protein